MSVGVKARDVYPKQLKQVDVTLFPAVLECANCSLHGTVGGALSETVATVSLSTVPRLSLLYQQSCHLEVGKRMPCGGQRAMSPNPTRATAPLLRSRSIKWRDQMTWHLDDSLLCGRDGQFWLFWEKSTQKDRREYSKTPRWRCWFGGSQPPRWQWKFGGRNNTSSLQCQSNEENLEVTSEITGCIENFSICRLQWKESCIFMPTVPVPTADIHRLLQTMSPHNNLIEYKKITKMKTCQNWLTGKNYVTLRY